MYEFEFKQLDQIQTEEELAKIGETPETLLEMALVGVVDTTIYIKVYGAEGPVPHFHFYETQSGRRGCIKILEASYFAHGKNLDDLKRDENLELVDWLKEWNDDFDKTNWEAICRLWNMNNPLYKLKDVNQSIPDYMRL